MMSRVQQTNARRQSEWREQRAVDSREVELPAKTVGSRKRKAKPIPDWLFMSMPNDVLYTMARFLWGGEMASASCVCRDLYKVCGETVVSEFVSHFGSRHPRRMVRTVLFRMVQKAKHTTGTNQTGLLLWASHHGYLKQVQTILQSPGFKKKNLMVRRPSDGATPLFLASEQNNMEVVRLLVGNGAQVNLGTLDGMSPLHAACREGHAAVARFLLDAKADFNKTGKSGYTPMMLAAENGHAKIIEVLASYGCDVNTSTQVRDDDGGETALHRACQMGHIEMAKILIARNCDINGSTKDGRTPLIVAAEEGHEDLVKFLIDNGADCRAVTKAGKTALYNACERGHVSIANMLLEGGSDPSQQTCRKKIALYTAAEQGNVDLVKVLLPFSKKADLFVETTYGTTPLFIATKSGSAEVKDLLVAFCSRGEKKKAPKVTASLARAPSTPRFNTDIDPVGERTDDFQRGRRPKSKGADGSVNVGDKDARMRREEEEATAAREKALKEKARRRDNAARRKRELEIAEEERKERRLAELEAKRPQRPGVDERSGKVGWSTLVSEEEHNDMVTRARLRREAKANMQADEYAAFEAQMRAEDERRAKDKERYLKKQEERRREAKEAGKENKAQAAEGGDNSNAVNNQDDPEREKRVAAFLKRQEDAAKKREEKLNEKAQQVKAQEKLRWQNVVTDGKDSDSAAGVAAGGGTNAVQVLREERKAADVKVVALDLDGL